MGRGNADALIACCLQRSPGAFGDLAMTMSDALAKILVLTDAEIQSGAPPTLGASERPVKISSRNAPRGRTTLNSDLIF
jgi:hypothetical protein